MFSMADPERDEYSLDDFEAWHIFEDTVADLKETIDSDAFKNLLYEFADYSVTVSRISQFSMNINLLPKELRDQMGNPKQIAISGLAVGLFRPNPQTERTQPKWQMGARFVANDRPFFTEVETDKLTLTDENTGLQRIYPVSLSLPLMASFLSAISRGHEDPKQFCRADRIDLPISFRLEEAMRLIGAYEGECDTSAISSWIKCDDQFLHIHQKERGIESPIQDYIFALAREENKVAYIDEFNLYDHFNELGEQRQALDIKIAKYKCSFAQLATLTRDVLPYQILDVHPTRHAQFWFDLAKNLSRVLGKLV